MMQTMWCQGVMSKLEAEAAATGGAMRSPPPTRLRRTAAERMRCSRRPGLQVARPK